MEALADFDKEIQKSPNVGDLYFFRGQVKMELNQRQAGEADLAKAKELGSKLALGAP
jgi:hypothetical protein